MRVIDLLPLLDVGIGKNDYPALFFRGTEFLASYGEFEVDCEAISVIKLLNSKVLRISPDKERDILRIFIEE